MNDAMQCDGCGEVMAVAPCDDCATLRAQLAAANLETECVRDTYRAACLRGDAATERAEKAREAQRDAEIRMLEAEARAAAETRRADEEAAGAGGLRQMLTFAVEHMRACGCLHTRDCPAFDTDNDAACDGECDTWGVHRALVDNPAGRPILAERDDLRERLATLAAQGRAVLNVCGEGDPVSTEALAAFRRAVEGQP